MATPIATYSVNSALGTGDQATLTTPSFTPSNGELIIVKLATWDTAQAMGAPTGGSQSFSSVQINAPGNFNCWTAIYAATVSGSPGSMTVSSTAPAVNTEHSMVVERWPAGSTVGGSAKANYGGTSGTPSVSVTCTGTNSNVSFVNADANGKSPSTRAYLLSATEDGLLDSSSSADSVQYHAYCSTTAPGSYTVGMSAPGLQAWNISAVEIKAASGSPSASASQTETFSVTTAVQVGKVASASLATTATISASGAIPRSASSSLASTVALTAQGATGGTANLATSATLSAQGATALSGSASLAISAALSAQGLAAGGHSGNLALSAALSAQGAVATSSSASVALSAALSAQGVVATGSSASLGMSAAIAAQGTAGASATIGVSAPLSAQGVTGVYSSASVALSALIAVQGSVATEPNGSAISALSALITAGGVVAIPGLSNVARGPVQRRRGLTVTIYPTKVIIDSRGNQVAIADMDHGYDARVWVVPERSQKAEVGGGQQDNQIVRLGTASDLPGLDSWSRIRWDGVMWDVVMPPAMHHGTRHVRHWTFDVRRRPSQHG